VGEAEVNPRWAAPPFIKASAALHVAGAAALVASPATWPWVLGAVVANHAGITAAGLWPRSTLLGPNITRLPATAAARNEVALTFDDGPDPDVTPRVLDFLDDINPDSRKVITAYLEPGLKEAQPEERFQFERHGYFVADRVDSEPGAPVFNRAVTLRDSWAKQK